MNAAENIIPISGNQRMSINKSSWAWSTHVGAASVKSVLVAMAECANSKTLMAFPSIAHLCEMTELNRKTIISSLSALVSMGLIEDTGTKTGVTSQIVVYRMMVGNSPKNGTVKSYGNSPKSGTVPETEQFQNVAETVPLLRETVPLLRGNSTRSGTRIPEVSLSIPEVSLIETAAHQEANPKPRINEEPQPTASDMCIPENDKKSGIAKKASKKASMPSDFAISTNVRDWANKSGYGLLDARLEHFRNWATAKGATYADWDAAFRNAIAGDWAGLNGRKQPVNGHAATDNNPPPPRYLN